MISGHKGVFPKQARNSGGRGVSHMKSGLDVFRHPLRSQVYIIS